MGEVIDFVGHREKKVKQKRRAFERIVFEDFPWAYALADYNNSEYLITLVDIDKKGLGFKVPLHRGGHKTIKKGTEIKMKIYFTEDSYIPIVVTIKHHKKITGKHDRIYIRYGCTFDTSLPSFEAMNKFIHFLYSFARYSHTDRHQLAVSG